MLEVHYAWATSLSLKDTYFSMYMRLWQRKLRQSYSFCNIFTWMIFTWICINGEELYYIVCNILSRLSTKVDNFLYVVKNKYSQLMNTVINVWAYLLTYMFAQCDLRCTIGLWLFAHKAPLLPLWFPDIKHTIMSCFDQWNKLLFGWVHAITM